MKKELIKWLIKTINSFNFITMQKEYTVINRGIDKPTRILVYNFKGFNQVDNIRWDDTEHPSMDFHCVAIFKIKLKNI